MEKKNVPLTREQVKALPVQKRTVKDRKGREKTVYLAAHQSEHSNNKERRAEKQRQPHHNAKQTAGRKYQNTEIVTKQDTKFGPVNVPTGFFRRITHKIADSKVIRAALKARARLMEKTLPFTPATGKPDIIVGKEGAEMLEQKKDAA